MSKLQTTNHTIFSSHLHSLILVGAQGGALVERVDERVRVQDRLQSLILALVLIGAAIIN